MPLSRIAVTLFAYCVFCGIVTDGRALYAQETPTILDGAPFGDQRVRDGMERLFGFTLFGDFLKNPEPSSSFDVIADPTDTQAPYTEWRHHTGTAAECVASLRIHRQGAQDQFVSGLVARCDGFVLVPRSAYEQIHSSAATGDLIVTGAEGETITKALPIAGWEKIAGRNNRIDYALLKVNDHHIRCLPLLSSSTVREGTAVRLVFAVPSVTPSAQTCSATAKPFRALIGISSDHGIHFALTAFKTEEGTPADANAVAAIPAGTAVIDVETGAALGIVTAAFDGATGSGALSFTTFARFNDEFPEIALAPSREALRQLKAAHEAAQTTSKQKPGGPIDFRVHRMLFVPGGPVTLNGALKDYYLTYFKTDVACTPDFQVDEFPVTNEDYRTWLKSNQGAAPPPLSWPVGELENPTIRDDVPLTGASPTAARSYLNSHDKRLLTEVEWERASKVKDLRWLEQLWRRWEDADHEYSTWALLQAVYYYCLAAGIYTHNGGRDLSQVGISPTVVTYFNENSSEQALADYKTVAKAAALQIEVQRKTGNFPRYIHPVGVYTDDVSIYGVHDVVLNAPELIVQVALRQPTAYKPFADNIDPNVSYVTYTHPRDPAVDGQSLDAGPIVDRYLYSQIQAVNTPPYFFQSHFWRYQNGNKTIDRVDFQKVPHVANKRGGGTESYNDWRPIPSLQWEIGWNNVVMPEFRGAR